MTLSVLTYTWADALVLTVVEGTTDESAAKDVAMHIAAINPKYVSSDQVSEEEINHEKKY